MPAASISAWRKPLRRSVCLVVAAGGTTPALAVGPRAGQWGRRSAGLAGHYTGQTEQGEPISFDVTDAGTTVANILFSINGDRGRWPTTVITIAHAFAIDSGGSWGDHLQGASIRVTIEGRLDRSAEARGTLRVGSATGQPAMNDRAADAIRWRARRVSAPAEPSDSDQVARLKRR
jgi:hypothetical protein